MDPQNYFHLPYYIKSEISESSCSSTCIAYAVYYCSRLVIILFSVHQFATFQLYAPSQTRPSVCFVNISCFFNKCKTIKPAILKLTRYLYISIPYNWHNFYNESTFITDIEHLHNVSDTLQHVQQCFKLKNIYNSLYAHPVNIMGFHDV